MIDQLTDILHSSLIYRADLLPSEWAEQKRTMGSDVSPFPGPFSYDRTPYTREIVNRFSPTDPAKTIACMKGAQVGFSAGVIENAIGWIIDQEPGNILFLTGHSDLSEEAMNKIDAVIDSAGLRSLIRPSTLRTRNQRTGDTNKSKEFPGGSLVAGSATNHKLLRQRSIRYGFIDDFEAVKSATKESGATTSMIEQRLAAYAAKMKLAYISTPELKETSNIEPVFLKGDQRRYYIPCQCCGVAIPLFWVADIEGSEDKAGMTWKLDSAGQVIPGSVGYVCQVCGGFFTDENKYEFNLAGFWQPTATPVNETYTSYHLSSLYAPPGMYDWLFYVRQYVAANPIGQPVKEPLMKAFNNLCLGITHESKGEAPEANAIQKNVRQYEVGMIPEKMSMDDGNGAIVLLTAAVDMNGTVEDSRLDYEVLAWAENGANYSVMQGSIGTFIPRENTLKHKVDREHWTYDQHGERSVWPVLDELLASSFETDTGRKMKVLVSGLDCGHFSNGYAYPYLERTNNFVIGLKGDKEGKYTRFLRDAPLFKPARERNNLYILEVGLIKDALSEYMELRWSPNDETQPENFMNFPQPSGGHYGFASYFEHFESEHRIVDTDSTGVGIAAKWVKKQSNSQNHFWDCRVYNIVVREILVYLVGKEAKKKSFTWKDYVDMVTQ